MSISHDVNLISIEFTSGLKRILGEKLHGAYIYGAAAFPDSEYTGDIDFHVILHEELTGEERSELERLHEYLGERFPPLGKDMDGYYILLEDARREAPPRSQMWQLAIDKSWALHREHILAGRCIVLHGPDPSEIYPPASWPEIEEALRGELVYVEEHLQQYPGYCILNLCRLIYSFETKDVVLSKAQAAAWARKALPGWKRYIDLAEKYYSHRASLEEERIILDGIVKFNEFSLERIEQAKYIEP